MSEGNHSINSVLRFARANDSRNWCFGGWPDDIMGIYLSWHNSNGSLVLVEDNGELVALAVGTKMLEADIDKHWRCWDESGDCMLLSDVVAKTKQGLAACLDELDVRCPEWRELKLFANRHGKRKQIKPEVFERIVERWK